MAMRRKRPGIFPPAAALAAMWLLPYHVLGTRSRDLLPARPVLRTPPAGGRAVGLVD